MKPSADKQPWVDWRRALTVGIITFVIAVTFALPAGGAVAQLNLFFALLVLFGLILIGIIFDIIGVAAAASDEAPFHAMSASDRPGARQSLWVARNADAVASFCNDVIGDVVGTVSGAAGATIAVRLLAATPTLDEAALNLLVIAGVAALTVGGKAAGKSLAIRRATSIVTGIGRVLYILERVGLIRLRVRRSRSKKVHGKVKVRR